MRNRFLALVGTALSLALLPGGNALAVDPTPSPSQSQTPTTTPSATQIPTPTPTPTPNKPKSCSIRQAATSANLAYFYGYAVNAKTGEVYLNVRGEQQTPSASVLKVVTAAAAISTLPTDYSATTTVLSVPNEPGTLVLKGGGDHTLSRLNPPSYTTYKKPPKLKELADAVIANWPPGVAINKIILDASFFDQPAWNTAWKSSDRTNGYMSLITGLQVDSDRANPDLTDVKYSGNRSTNPVLSAGKYFRIALGDLAKTASLVEAKTPSSAVEISRVNSQPITVWLDHALKYSDNTETEYIAKHALKYSGKATSFKNIQALAVAALKKLKIDSKKLVMLDGSGLAQGDRVTAKLITQIMAKAADPASPLSTMFEYLPVSGVSGTLSARFTGVSKAARGAVHAKSGYIPGLYSLAGIVMAKDGTPIAFSAFSREAGGKKLYYSARAAHDALAARFYECGAGSYY
jgi:D-alanyl-D-alanine carboxypeptidase/D-alanyl-D-alanine-endopeptidase (penicillin-binding protein 4)